jgi:hypothetical protein
MPVAQIVAGFSKVFVGEIVEKGKRLGMFMKCVLLNVIGQRARCKNVMEILDLFHPIIFGRLIIFINSKRGVLVLRDR